MEKNKKNIKIFAILGIIAGVALILLSFAFPGSNNNAKKNINNNLNTDLSVTDNSRWIREQEVKLESLLKKIVSEPLVMITLENSGEYIYASKQNIKESSSKNGESTQKEVSKDIIFYGDEKKPILVKEIEPKIKGVAVVCANMNAETELKIINLVSAVLNLPSNKIYVIGFEKAK